MHAGPRQKTLNLRGHLEGRKITLYWTLHRSRIGEGGPDSSGGRQAQVAGFCKCGHEYFGSTKRGEFLD